MVALIEQAIALLLRLIGVAQAIQFVVNILNGPPASSPPGSILSLTLREVQLVESELSNPTYGLAHILSTIATNQMALLTAIATRQSGSTSVILPASPPAGYGGASANDVWNHMEPGSTRTVGYWQEQMGAFALNVASLLQIPSNYAPEILVYYDYANEFTALPSTFPTPNFDVSTILPGDATASAWLNRIDTHGWVFSQNAFGFAQADNLIPGYGGVVCTIDAHRFAELKSAAAAPSPSAPVWPGLAHVTLGAPVAITPAFDVVGPMHGVIVDITGHRIGLSSFDYHGLTAYQAMGAFTFVDDNGDGEAFVPLSFVHQVYTPTRMAVAARAKFRCDVDTLGTVTPWTIS